MSRLYGADATKHPLRGVKMKTTYRNVPSAAKRYFVASSLDSRDIYVMVLNYLMPLTPLLPLCGFAFLAGFMDAMVGGGGLIQLPALFVLLPGVAAPTVLGTNKLVAMTGTLVAAGQYARHVKIDWPVVLPAAATAFVCSALGAHLVSGFRTDTLRPLILVLLLAVAGYVFARKDFGKDFGAAPAPRLSPARQRWYGIGAGGVIGFYDGFFGPGTGSFLIFTFIGVFGLSFLAASASAKVVNAATNFAAVLLFGLTGHLLYALALPMAVCSIGGSVLGTRLAVAKGSRFVRVLFLVVLSAVIAKFAWDTFRR